MSLHKILPVLFLLCGYTLIAQVPPPPPPMDSIMVDNKIFTKVDVEADFVGGNDAWRKYLVKNLNPEVPANNNAPAGKYTVIVKFVVSRDGSLSDINAETNMGYGMEQEVIRIIQRSGSWTPAYQNKRTVNAYRRQPVTFLVEDDGFTINTKQPYTLFSGENMIYVDAGKRNKGNLRLSISEGTITPTDDEGYYIVRLKETGRVIIRIYNSKNNNEIGAASFEVKKKN